MTKLSNVLSEVIVQAVNDLQLCMEDEKYKVNMNRWHKSSSSGICSVCLAGAVMAKSLGASPEVIGLPEDFEEDTQKLIALDLVRRGYLKKAIKEFNNKDLELFGIKERLVKEFSDNPQGFIQDMLDVADYLKEKGY